MVEQVSPVSRALDWKSPEEVARIKAVARMKARLFKTMPPEKAVTILCEMGIHESSAGYLMLCKPEASITGGAFYPRGGETDKYTLEQLEAIVTYLHCQEEVYERIRETMNRSKGAPRTFSKTVKNPGSLP